MRLIPLRTQDDVVRAYAFVDDGDYDHLAQWRWYLTAKGYAARNTSRGPRGGAVQTQFLMHREVLELPPHDRRFSDHINGDRLDNRRKNLRVATNAENMQNRMGLAANNSSGYRGVSRHKASGRWRGRAAVGALIHDRLYATPSEAAAAVVAFRAAHMPFSEDARTA